MKRTIPQVLALFLLISALPLAAQDSAFTYQGQLKQSGTPYTGTVEMVFTLWTGPDNSLQIGNTLNQSVAVTDGLFQVELDFGNAFGGDPLWLQMEVAGQALDPRQRLAPAPLALHALSADAQIADGSVTMEKLADGAVTAPKLAAESISHAKLDDDARPRWAVVEPDGSVARIRGDDLIITKESDPGWYLVQLAARTIDDCAVTATIGTYPENSTPVHGFATVQHFGPETSAVRIRTFGTTWAPMDNSFHVTVLC